MAKSHLPRLQHIIEATAHIFTLTDGKQLSDLEADRGSRLLIERNFEIISEASRHLPDDLKARHQHIPWRQIAALGNVIRHDYDGIEPDILLTIARENLIDLERVAMAELALVQRGIHPC